jgi:hypothetical protein
MTRVLLALRSIFGKCSCEHYMNRYLFELLRRIEEGARRLASTITSSGETRLRDITLVHVELEEITNAVEAFKTEVAGGASVGYIGGRLIKKEGD